MFLHVSVILFTGGGLPQCMLGYPPETGTPPPPGSRPPPQEQTPQDQAPPSSDPPEQTPPEQTPHGADTLPQSIPPCAVHTGRYGQQAGSMHPTGMQSCF